MKAVLVLQDQLNRNTKLFEHADPDDTVVAIIESLPELTVVPFHKQRVTLVLSAMRHFAEELQLLDYKVAYYEWCDNPSDAIAAIVKEHKLEQIRIMESADHGVSDRFAEFARHARVEVDLVENDMFISNRLDKDFSFEPDTAKRMEGFYRNMRRATGILMDDDEPVGGAWNYDKQNRDTPGPDVDLPVPRRFRPDDITKRVMREVEENLPDHFGSTEGFAWAVTRREARAALRNFLDERLPDFGQYQDAMVAENETMFHSLLSSSLNIGLLDAEEVCREAEARYESGEAPINSVEGFIRQILGWREFVYQLYRANMPGYDNLNALDADLRVPEPYWSGETEMRCIALAVDPVIGHAHNHHIQRLMVTGNFALLAGVSPQELNRWYWIAYIDAWNWVVSPNVLGMAAYADGGLMASKPYAASANYINKMSDYCTGCAYNPKDTTGEDACPFNALYWDFLDRNASRLAENNRMSLVYANLERKSDNEMKAIRSRANSLRKRLADGESL